MAIRRIPLVSYLYLALAVLGLVGTWWFNVQVLADGENFLSDVFANSASSSIGVDVLVTATAANIFIVLESRRIGLRWGWVLVPVSLFIAIAFAFPLFLAWRAWRLAEVPPAASP
ncbi:MAG: DUF2834 domain-containing protein [Angustibacter sp.]